MKTQKYEEQIFHRPLTSLKHENKQVNKLVLY